MHGDPRRQLVQQGYCVARGLLPTATMTDLRAWAAPPLRALSAAHRSRNRSQGSLINIADYPDFAGIIGHAALGALFDDLGFADPAFSSGYLISKPPHSPALFWHQDWWGWDDPLSYSDAIAQVFVMIYLTATTPANGCLRVIPRSHRCRHPLHEAPEAHAEDLSRVANPNDPLYHAMPGETAVPVSPGDVVIGDARLLHGSFANVSDAERTLLTLWYHPDFARLPAGMRSRIREIFLRRGVDTDPAAGEAMLVSDWPGPQLRKVRALLPDYAGKAPPHAWNRRPDASALRASNQGD